MRSDRPGRRFYAVAAGAGFAFANMAIAVPLQVVASGADASVAGDILAAATISVAVGALVAGRLGAHGRRSVLAAAAAVAGGGSLAVALAPRVAALALGACIVGAGIGMFWVVSQFVLARRAGEPDGARAFLLHYAAYTLGAVVGSTMTGALASAADALGLGVLAGLRAGSLLALVASVGGAALWRASPASALEAPPPQEPSSGLERRLAVQLPDLLLVAALALLLPLAPVLLAREFGLEPFAVGLVMGGVALSKIAGTFVARLVAGSSGPRRTILILLAAGASFCLLLCSALTLSLFVTSLFATALAGTGAWPLVVDAAQARVEPAARRSLAVRWNAREYVLIAATTAAAGWLLTELGSAVPLFLLAALLFGSAAASAAVLLRRPAWHPAAASSLGG